MGSLLNAGTHLREAATPTQRSTCKTAAEVIKLRQDGEWQAWGLDAVTEANPAGVKTMDELDAMFTVAMRRAEDMRDKVQRERGSLLPSGNAPN
jgi:hypothetical protein